MFWRKKDKPLTREDVARLFQEAGSLDKLDLSGRNLKGIDLSGVNLSRVNLSGANLRGANLSRADLASVPQGAFLRRGAFLYGANLSGANLSRADLRGAEVTLEQLQEALSLEGTIMPDGSRHP